MSERDKIRPGQILVADREGGSEGTNGKLPLKVQTIMPDGRLVVSPCSKGWPRRKLPIILDPKIIGTGVVVDGGKVGNFSFPKPKEKPGSE